MGVYGHLAVKRRPIRGRLIRSPTSGFHIAATRRKTNASSRTDAAIARELEAASFYGERPRVQLAVGLCCRHIGLRSRNGLRNTFLNRGMVSFTLHDRQYEILIDGQLLSAVVCRGHYCIPDAAKQPQSAYH